MAKSIFDIARETAQKAYTNFKGNVQALANPNTRNLWLTGATSPQPAVNATRSVAQAAFKPLQQAATQTRQAVTRAVAPTWNRAVNNVISTSNPQSVNSQAAAWASKNFNAAPGVQSFWQNLAPRRYGEAIGQTLVRPFDYLNMRSMSNTDLNEANKMTELGLKLQKQGKVREAQNLFAKSRELSNRATQTAQNFRTGNQQLQKTIVQEGIKTGLALGGAGYTAANPLMPVVGGLISGTMGMVSGEGFTTAAGRGMAESLPYSGVMQFTSPAITIVANKFGNIVKNPIFRQVLERGAAGVGNILENRIIDKSVGNQSNIKNDIFAFTLGALTHQSGQKIRGWAELPAPTKTSIIRLAKQAGLDTKPVSWAGDTAWDKTPRFLDDLRFDIKKKGLMEALSERNPVGLQIKPLEASKKHRAGLDTVLQKSQSQEQAIANIRQYLDEQLSRLTQKPDANEVKGLRAAINRTMYEMAGVDPAKGKYEAKLFSAAFDNPEIRDALTTLEGYKTQVDNLSMKQMAQGDVALPSGAVKQGDTVTYKGKTYTVEPQYGYHGTPAKNLESIRKQGLKVGKSGANAFTTLGEKSAEEWNRQLNAGQKGSVLRVNREKIKTFLEDGGEIFSREDIPPELIEVKTANGWKPLVETKPTAKKYKYTYYHATPNKAQIEKNGFQEDTYAWPTRKQAEQFAKTEGKGWEVVEVKSSEPLPITTRNYSAEERMDNGELWLLKKDSIIPSSQLGKTKPKAQYQTPEIKTGQQRGFTKQVLKTPGTPEPVAKAVKTSPESYYGPTSNKETMTRVAKTILKKGDDFAYGVATNEKHPDANATAMALIDKYLKTNQYNKAIELIDKVNPRFTQQGQQIQILSQYGKLTPSGAVKYAKTLIDKVNQTRPPNQQVKLTDESVAKITEAAKGIKGLPEGSREQLIAIQTLMKEIANPIPPSIGQYISSIQTMAQLLNPKTLIRNTGGNTIFAGLENVSDVVGTGMDKILSIFTGKRSKVLPSVTAQVSGAKRGITEGVEDVMKGIDTSGGTATQYDLPTQTFKGKYNPLTYLEKLLNIGLRATDRAASTAAYEGSLNNQMRAAGVKTPTPEMIAAAHQDALYRTFQDNSKLAEMFVGLKKLLNKIGTPDGKFGLGDLIIKYPKTPANLLSRSLDYSPAGFLKGVYEATRPLMTGQPFNQKAFVENLSRGLVGTGLVTTGYILAKKGILSGRAEKDKDIAALQREGGTGGFRLNVDALKRFALTGQKQKDEEGDTTVSYDWAQPSSLGLAMGANFFMNPKGDDAFMAALEQLDAGVSTLTQQSVMQGVTRFMGDVKDYGPVRAATNTILSTPASFIPTSMSQIAQYTGNNITKETYDPNAVKQALNVAQAKIPGLEAQLPERIGTFGEPVERYQGGSNTFFNVFLNPAFVGTIKNNPEAKEVLDIFERTGETKQAPRLAPKYIKVGDQTHKLTPEKYNEYQKLIGQSTKKEYEKLLADPTFQQFTDTNKAKVMANVLQKVNEQAKAQLFGIGAEDNAIKSQKIIEELKGKSRTEQIKILSGYKADGTLTKSLYTSITTKMKQEAAGVTEAEKYIMNKGTDEEAQYHYSKTKDMTTQQKISYFRNLKQKGLLTEAVYKEVAKLYSQQ